MPSQSDVSSSSDSSSSLSYIRYSTDREFLEISSETEATDEVSSDNNITRDCTEESKSQEFNTDKHLVTVTDEGDSIDDEWREVKSSDHQVYYYNRRTRRSVWKLPPAARLVGSTDIGDGNKHETRACKPFNNENIFRGDLNRKVTLNHSSSTFSNQIASGAKRVLKTNRYEVNSNSFSSSAKTLHDNDVVPKVNDLSIDSTKKLWNSETSFKNIFCSYCGQQCHLDKLANHLNSCNIAISSCRKNPLISSNIEEIYSKFRRQLSFVEGQKVQFDHDTSLCNSTLSSITASQISSEMFTPKQCNTSTRDKDQSVSSRTNSLSMKGKSLLSRCPFCSKEFSGEKLSGHLLYCEERKKARSKREESHRVSQKAQNDSPLKRLITKGGRHLPGYPSLAKKL